MDNMKEKTIRVSLGKDVLDRGAPYEHEVVVDIHVPGGAVYIHDLSTYDSTGVYLYPEQVARLRALIKATESGLEILVGE